MSDSRIKSKDNIPGSKLLEPYWQLTVDHKILVVIDCLSLLFFAISYSSLLYWTLLLFTFHNFSRLFPIYLLFFDIFRCSAWFSEVLIFLIKLWTSSFFFLDSLIWFDISPHFQQSVAASTCSHRDWKRLHMIIARYNIVIVLLLGIALKAWEPRRKHIQLTNILFFKTRPNHELSKLTTLQQWKNTELLKKPVRQYCKYL